MHVMGKHIMERDNQATLAYFISFCFISKPEILECFESFINLCND